MTVLVIIYSRKVNTYMCKPYRNMVNLREQTSPKPILYTVTGLDIGTGPMARGMF